MKTKLSSGRSLYIQICNPSNGRNWLTLSATKRFLMSKMDFGNWTDIKIDSAKFIFHQAEIFLKSTCETTTSLTSRAVSLIQILIPLIGIDFVYVTSFILNKDFSNVLLHVSTYFLLVLSFCLFKAIRMYRTVPVADPGSQPLKLATKAMLFSDLEYQELILILNEIEQYQDRIENNLSNNIEKARQFREILSVIFWAFCVGLVYAVIASIIS